MIPAFGLIPARGWTRAANLTVVLVFLAAVLTEGCGKQEPVAAPAPASPPAKQSIENLVANPSAPPPPNTVATPAAGVEQQGSDVSVDVANLTIELRIFVSQKKRFPADLNELARASGLKLPVPPKGGRLVIDKESKSVKMVGGN